MMATPPRSDWIEWGLACRRICEFSGDPGPFVVAEPYLIQALRDGEVRSRRTDTEAELDPAFWREGKAAWTGHPVDFGVDVNRKTLEAWLTPGPKATAGPGAPARYDWEAFWIEIAALAHRDPDGLPETQATLVHRMEAWFEDQIGKSPATSLIEEKVSKLYRRAFPSK